MISLLSQQQQSRDVVEEVRYNVLENRGLEKKGFVDVIGEARTGGRERKRKSKRWGRATTPARADAPTHTHDLTSGKIKHESQQCQQKKGH